MITFTTPSYYWLNSWVMSNIVQLATQSFCKRFLNRTNDPCGRQYDQMTQSARSGQANIAEGNSRHSTSRETELKLLDVARASISELAGDYINWLLAQGIVPWSIHDSLYQHIDRIDLDKADYTDNVIHNSSLHIIRQKAKFDEWINSDDPNIAANCILILCMRLHSMLIRQMERLVEDFRQEGGFTEAMTAERLAARTQQSQQKGAPSCPQCGKPMIKRMCKKGIHAGREFWSCSGYPQCQGTRDV